MKGVSYITNNKNQRKAVIIELKSIEDNDEEIHDLIDMLVAESRKDDTKRSWTDVKRSLKKKGKI